MIAAPPISAVSARLLGLEGADGRRPHVGTIRMVVDRKLPGLVMYEGEPFLLSSVTGGASFDVSYVQTVPFRADAGLLVRGAS